MARVASKRAWYALRYVVKYLRDLTPIQRVCVSPVLCVSGGRVISGGRDIYEQSHSRSYGASSLFQ